MSFIYLPFSYIMKACVWISQNSYLFGLFFFALIFELLLFPLAIKQQKSQISMAKIRPKEMAIREKYAGRTDRVTQQKMQMEIQEMHQQEGYSPLSGCLPLLIQLPLVIILYAIVRYPIQYSSNFTEYAQTQIETVVVEQHEEYTGDDAFKDVFAQYAFDYAENIREHLVKDSEAAAEANELLTEEVNKLGLLTPKEGTDYTAYETYGNGFHEYVLDISDSGRENSNRELAAANIIINFGDEYVAGLKEQGALDESYDASLYPLCCVENGETLYYADMMPDFSFFGINLLSTPSFTDNDSWRDWILILVPILVFLTSFLSHKLMMRYQSNPQTDANGNPVGQGMFMSVGMPLMSAVFTLMFPAAIGTYWIWRTLISMLKTPILHKLYPIPKLSKEEMDAAVRELRSKEKAKKKKVITIEVDEDDDSYADIEVKSRVESARPKANPNGKKADLPYRKPTKIEMLSAEDVSSDENKE